MKYKVARLNDLAVEYPEFVKERYSASEASVIDAMNKKEVECPMCFGAQKLASHWGGAIMPSFVFDCPGCNGAGTVIRPAFGLEDMNGGWGLCPYCFEGQCSDEEPCDVCEYWLDELDKGKVLSRRATRRAKE